MSEEQREHEVFDQELSVDDLNAAAGGSVTFWYSADKDENHCIEVHERQFYLAVAQSNVPQRWRTAAGAIRTMHATLTQSSTRA